MRIVNPGSLQSDSSLRSQTRVSKFRAATEVLVVVGWPGYVAISLESFSVGEWFFGVLTPVFGLVMGGIAGFGLGAGIVAEVFSQAIAFPAASAAMLGAAAGILSAWFGRAHSVKQNYFRRSFISSLFSREILEGNAAGFVCHLLVSTAIGIALSVVLASVGVFEPATAIGENWRVILAGGSGGPWDSGFTGMLLALFYMLGALLIACGMAGFCIGGVLGGAIGAGFSTIGVPAFIGGASEGLAFRFFAHFRPKDVESGRLSYFVAGAGIGAAEGVFVGFATGAVLFLAQAASIMG